MTRLDARPLDVALQERADAGDVPEPAPPHGVLLLDAGATDQSVCGEPVGGRPADSEDPADLGGGAFAGLEGVPPRTDICGADGGDGQGGFGAEGGEEAFGGLVVFEGCLVGAFAQLAAAPLVEELRDGGEVQGLAGGFLEGFAHDLTDLGLDKGAFACGLGGLFPSGGYGEGV
jgi:hypothetical protein